MTMTMQARQSSDSNLLVMMKVLMKTTKRSQMHMQACEVALGAVLQF